jgi:hypothetical protein
MTASTACSRKITSGTLTSRRLEMCERTGFTRGRNVIRSAQDYWYSIGRACLLFGKVKIWGEVVEHEWGYRSQFAKVISLDYGDPELLEKLRKIYRVNQVARAGQ